MKIESYTLSPSDLQMALNASKEELIDALAREGLLQNPEEIKAKYAIVIAHKSWLGRENSGDYEDSLGQVKDSQIDRIVFERSGESWTYYTVGSYVRQVEEKEAL